MRIRVIKLRLRLKPYAIQTQRGGDYTDPSWQILYRHTKKGKDVIVRFWTMRGALKAAKNLAYPPQPKVVWVIDTEK